MKKLKFRMVLIIGIIAVSISSCKKEGCTDSSAKNYSSEAKKDDGSCVYEAKSNREVVSGHITANTTWTTDKIWELAGKVIVDNGITLTIEAGTIIQGQEGTGTLASALIIERGAKIIANGTADKPIIFTSVLSDIKVGQSTGTNLDETDKGLWGGVLILGNAPVSVSDGDAIGQVEGIPTSDTYGAYGGNNSSDNSGVFSYVSIRHGGAIIGAGNEINGLTLAGVGTGTVVSNIEIIANVDDGIEFFGGTVNVDKLLVYFQGDDGIDIDQNYAGTVSNFTVINGSDSDKGTEVDGPENTTHKNGMFTLINGTFMINGSADFAPADFRAKAQGTITNVKLGLIKIAVSYTNDCADESEDAFSHLMDLINPTLVYTNSTFSSYSVYTKSMDNAGINPCSVHAGDDTAPSSVMVSSGSATGNTTPFPWTWCAAKGKI